MFLIKKTLIWAENVIFQSIIHKPTFWGTHAKKGVNKYVSSDIY